MRRISSVSTRERCEANVPPRAMTTALDHILQFTHIARPAIALRRSISRRRILGAPMWKRPLAWRRNVRSAPGCPRCGTAVAAPASKIARTVVDLEPEPLLVGLLPQVSVGGGHDAHVHQPRGLVARRARCSSGARRIRRRCVTATKRLPRYGPILLRTCLATPKVDRSLGLSSARFASAKESWIASGEGRLGTMIDAAQRAASLSDGAQIRRATEDDRDGLFDIWLRSVRATHTFVSEADIESFMPLVRDYLASSETECWVLCDADGAVMGFMGMAGPKMESLFLAPECPRTRWWAAPRRACACAPGPAHRGRERAEHGSCRLLQRVRVRRRRSIRAGRHGPPVSAAPYAARGTSRAVTVDLKRSVGSAS